MLYAHKITYPELAVAKVAVVTLEGEMIGGPDRRNETEAWKWKEWQHAVQSAARTPKAVPQNVMDYFQATKHLMRPPQPGDKALGGTGMLKDLLEAEDVPAVLAPHPLSEGKIPDGGIIIDNPMNNGGIIRPTTAFKPPRFTWSYTSLQEFLTCPAQWAAKRYYKTIKEGETEAMRVGNLVHETAEHYLKSKIGVSFSQSKIHSAYLPQVQKYCDALVASGAELHVEKEMCFDKNMKPSHWKAWDTVWVRSKADVLAKKSNKVSLIDWKGLALDTPLPTPTGWTTMGAVLPGDQVFGADGTPCTVIGKSKIKNIPCYEITFCDGSKITCDHEHLWEVRKRVGKGVYKPAIVSAHDLCARTEFEKLNVRLAQPLQTTKEKSGLPFYTIGCWLGDGKHTDGSITKGDLGIFDHIVEEGLLVKAPMKAAEGRCAARTVVGLRTILRQEGLIGNKHIPARWLRASYADRLALLQGLMDTDGSWNFVRTQAVFCTVNRSFADEVFELLASLGQRPTIHTIDGFGFGKAVRSYEITFTPVNGLTPFRCDIKKDKFEKYPSKQPRAFRRVKSVKLVNTVPTQCIKVDSVDSMYLCGKAMIPTHNTGKYKEDFLQLEMFAVFTALTPGFEDVQEFDPKFIFLKEAAPKNILRLPQPIKRSELKATFKKILEIVRRMETAWESETFPCRKNGLCKNYCANTDCAHCGG